MKILVSMLVAVVVFSGSDSIPTTEREGFERAATTNSVAELNSFNPLFRNIRIICSDEGPEMIAALCRFKNLERLDISRAETLKDADLKPLANCTTLRSLTLEDAEKVSANGISPIGQMKNLTKLELDCDGLNAECLAEIVKLNELVYLKLNSDKTIDNATAREVAKIKGLKELRIGLKKCESFNDEGLLALANLENLEVLKLYRAPEIGDKGFAALTKLNHLRELSVEGSPKITDKGLAAFKDNSVLEELDLTGCEGITGASMKVLATMTALADLDSRGIVLDGDHLAELGKSESLRRFALHVSKENPSVLESVGKLKGLTKLGIEGGVFTEKAMESIGSLQKLENLDCCPPTIPSNTFLQHLTDLPKLRILTLLSPKGLNNHGVLYLSKIQPLEDLDISLAEDVDDDAVKHLKKIKNLKRLSVMGTSISDEGLAELRATFPRAQIN
ncbi:hypothetical protein OAU50_01405 [Planctomycetota bacterium]|nr:hypothetical protein [Planctomycetota bacterium]